MSEEKYNSLKDKVLDDKMTTLDGKNIQNENKIQTLLEKMAYFEGYFKGEKETKKTIINYILQGIPILISIIALLVSIFKK